MMKTMKATEQKRVYHLLLMATVFILAFGTVFYHFVEGWSWIDSYYFCVVTLATIGYGDFIPQTNFAKIFTTIYIFVGIGILSAFIKVFLTGHGKQIMEKHQHHKEESEKHKP